jgi:TorA maturation chaperone TorD
MTPIDINTVAAQADLCRLLAACYYEPTAEFVEEGVFAALSEAAERIDPALATLAQPLKPAFAAESGENLLVDYAKLFLGPGQTLAPPYESAWRDKNSASPVDSTHELIEQYAAGGFELDPEFRDLPDHLAVELEFLYTLLFQLAVALSQHDQPAIERAQTLRRAFLEQHLAEWIEPFAAAMSAGAGCEFYRRLAELTRAFVRSEIKR